ncbi:MAG: thiamine pyrophosphate-binding protein [Deltaproteobacteria bacterium]|nr:thiamine pyrophosphate-binding protein [Deltaproteobacteria bacterium]
MDFGARLAAALEKAAVKVAASVPDNWLEGAIEKLGSSASVVHTSAAREEDALGICMGAALAGARSVCLMQNSGVLNTGGTLATLGNAFGIPLVMIVTDRGHLGDVLTAHFEKARAFRPFLEALQIPYYELSPAFDREDQIEQAFVMAEAGQRPVALLITRAALEDKK